MNKIIAFIATAAAFSVSNLFAATDPTKAFEERFGTEKIHATQYRIPAKTAEKIVKEYHAKGNNHKHSI